MIQHDPVPRFNGKVSCKEIILHLRTQPVAISADAPDTYPSITTATVGPPPQDHPCKAGDLESAHFREDVQRITGTGSIGCNRPPDRIDFLLS